MVSFFFFLAANLPKPFRPVTQRPQDMLLPRAVLARTRITQFRQFPHSQYRSKMLYRFLKPSMDMDLKLPISMRTGKVAVLAIKE